MASKKNEAKIRFTAETKDFNKAISKANGDMAEFRSELNLNQAEMKGMADTTDKLAERKEILAKQYVSAGEKTDALRKKMEVAARIYGENSSEAQKLKVAVNNAAAAQEKAWQELQATKKALQDQASASEDTRTSLEKLEDTITEQEDALEALRKEYANSVLENGKYDKGTKDLAKSINELSGDLQKNKKKLDAAGGAAEDAGNDAEKSAEGWTIVKDVIADMASQALASAAEGFKELMLEGEAALDMFQAKTGLSSGAIDNMGHVMYDVFNGGWGESLDEVSEAMSTIYAMNGDMDDEFLQQYTENAMTLADVWGYDIAESMRAVNALEKQFGISGEDAFDLIAEGAQMGLDQNGDLLDTINEYSVHFSQLGMGADDMFNVLNSGAASGTFSIDKLGDAVKEFGIRAMDDSDTTAEAFKDLGLNVEEMEDKFAAGGDTASEAFSETLKRLGQVDNKVWQNQIGVALFGTMWEDLGAETMLALGDIEGGLSATNDVMSQVKTDAYDNLSTSLTTLGRTLKNEILMPVVDLITPAVKGIVDWCIENMEILKPIIIGVGTAFGVLAGALAISGIISGVQKAFALLNTTLLANPITLIIAAIAGLVAAFIYLWNNCEGFREFWINLWEVVTNAFDVAWAWIVNFFTVTIPEVWNTTIAAISEFVASAIAWFSDMASGIGQWFSDAYNSVVQWCTEMWNSATEWFGQIWASISSACMNIWTSISTWFTTAKDSAISAVIGAYDSVVQWFGDMWDSITSTCSGIWTSITEAWNKIKTSVSQAVQSVRNTVANKFESLKNSVSNIWESVKSSIASVWSGIKTNVSQAVAGVRNTVTNIFDSVKSKVTKVWEGIKSAIQNPIETARDLVESAINKIKGFFNFSFTWPKLKMPHFSFTGSWNPFDWPDKFPKIGVEWYAKGGILNGPTLFGINSSGQAMVGGEAGPEAVAPIDVLLNYVRTAVQDVYHNADRLENSANFSGFERVIDSIESFANRPIELYIDGKKFATATAGATDSVTGNRMNFRSRGLAIE